MKRNPWIILFSISFIICTILYLRYDKIGFQTGLDCIFCDKKLPYNLLPLRHSEYPHRFYLNDEDDFELVGVGFKYYTSSFTIKDFLGYGYNNSSVIVKCTDSLNGIKYLISYETKYRSKKGNPLISFKDLSESDFEQVKSKYEWLDVGKEKYHAIESNKFLFMIGALLSLILFVWRLFNLEASKPR
jgi:hypothetical protein